MKNIEQENQNGQQGTETVDRKTIADTVLGGVVWVSESEGFCDCPGRSRHTTRDNQKDCKVYLDPVPTITCFHGSCTGSVEETNKKLRSALYGGEFKGSRKLTAEEKNRLLERERKERIRRRAGKSKIKLLRQNCWPYEQIQNDSPVDVKSNLADHWRLLLGCFDQQDVVWIGGTFDSGKLDHKNHFRPVEEWLKGTVPSGQYLCPSAFRPESYSRTNDNVASRRFLVVESDVLGRDEVGGVFRWMEIRIGLRLRAIVDTAGKSLHAWFDYPDGSTVEELKLVLPALGCDPKLFTPSQPVRLPSALRDGKHQKLVYLNAEVSS